MSKQQAQSQLDQMIGLETGSPLRLTLQAIVDALPDDPAVCEEARIDREIKEVKASKPRRYFVGNACPPTGGNFPVLIEDPDGDHILEPNNRLTYTEPNRNTRDYPNA